MTWVMVGLVKDILTAVVRFQAIVFKPFLGFSCDLDIKLVFQSVKSESSSPILPFCVHCCPIAEMHGRPSVLQCQIIIAEVHGRPFVLQCQVMCCRFASAETLRKVRCYVCYRMCYFRKKRCSVCYRMCYFRKERWCVCYLMCYFRKERCYVRYLICYFRKMRCFVCYLMCYFLDSCSPWRLDIVKRLTVAQTHFSAPHVIKESVC